MAVASRAALSCEVCAAPARITRHSDRWGFDVATCTACATVFVVDVPELVKAGLTSTDGKSDMDWDWYVGATRNDDELRLRVLERLRSMLPTELTRPLLFDVGAGAGSFLSLARDNGFEVSGNELSPAAIKFAAETRQIALSDQLIDMQPQSSVHAMTMWCVLAHVPDARSFLTDALRMLRPGGVLFLRTPRKCLIDTVGNAMLKGSAGRLPGLADRRVVPGHWRLYSASSLAALLTDVGFVDVEATPVVHYSLTTDTLISSTGGPLRIFGSRADLLDRMIRRGWVPRNAVTAFARRPVS